MYGRMMSNTWNLLHRNSTSERISNLLSRTIISLSGVSTSHYPFLRTKTWNSKFLTSFRIRSMVTGSSFIPRRAVLYVPADNFKMTSKISEMFHVDCPVLECEDGVSISRKEAAREGVLSVLCESTWPLTRKRYNRDVAVRINSISSGLAEEDLRVILSGKVLPTSLFVPKTDSVEDIEWISEKLQKYLPENSEVLRLVIYVESAKGLVSLKKILRKAIELGDKRNKFQVDAVIFGSDDYCADIGATRTNQATEVLFARQHFLAVVKSFRRGIQTIDLVHIDYKDLADLKRQAKEGSEFGFSGKQIIHPSQVEVVQTTFSPSVEKIQWATELISAWEFYQSKGQGAFTFRNSMIDKPLLLQAQNVLELQKILSDTKPTPAD